MNWYKKALREYEKLKDGEVYMPSPPVVENRQDTQEVPSKWIPVNSSFISHVAYYEPLGMFELKLVDGRTYSFKDVPKNVYKRFMKAKSKGEFFNRVIKSKYGPS